MITRVEFKNFKALADVAIDLERFTVLVGPNACGKTSVLEGIHQLSVLPRTYPEPHSSPVQGANSYFFSKSGLSKYVTKDENSCSIAIIANNLTAKITKNGSKESYFQTINHDKNSTRSTALNPSIIDDDGISYQLISQYKSVELNGMESNFLNLNPHLMRGTSHSDLENPILAKDGSNIAAVLSHISLTSPLEFKQILTHLSAVIPSVIGIRLPRAKFQKQITHRRANDPPGYAENIEVDIWGNRIELEFREVGFLESNLISDGTLIALGLFTAIFSSPRTPIILIDDIDQGLHPIAQRELIYSIRKILAHLPPIQIICTSHSPYIIDHFAPEEVRVMGLSKGRAICKKLTDHPEYDEWKDHLRAGEFWSNVGESWVGEEIDE